MPLPQRHHDTSLAAAGGTLAAMAIVFVPLNGIGLGHVARAFALAKELRRTGAQPVIFSQGCYPPFMAAAVPGVSIGTIYTAPPAIRNAIAADLETYARRTPPAVVIDDTHPAPVQLTDDVTRILIVRPTEMDQMRELRDNYAGAHRAALIADDPESPTWPFSAAETAEIAGWPQWSRIGPVFRSSTHASRSLIRQRYRLDARTRVCVFTMGGGGAQRSARDESLRFCREISAIGARLRARDPLVRLLFVRGPLFPDETRVPDLFEEHGVEPDMPSLLAVADGAVIRPGHNTVWECLAGGTPFIAVPGETFAEPVEERLARLRAQDLLASCPELFLDDRWCHAFRRRCRRAIGRRSIRQAVGRLVSTIGSLASPRPRVVRTRRPSRRCGGRGGVLLIRIDDVTHASDELAALVDLCAARGLAMSLDVIPYLAVLDNATLRQVAAGARYEVAQHGYDHLPRRRADGRKTEFTADADEQTASLSAGASIMRERFGAAFRGGLSVPFDAMPPNLPSTWAAIGGRYVTAVDIERDSAPPIPIVRLTLDPWDWIVDGPHPFDDTLDRLSNAFQRQGYAGLVLHPQLLQRRREADRLEQLLDWLLSLGCRSQLLSEFAGAQSSSDRPRDRR